MRRPAERLQDILSSIVAIERYASQGQSAFDEQELIQVWIVHHLQIIGEATNALPEEMLAQYPQVPWSKIVGLRNLIIHEYFRVALNLVWAIVQNDLPVLKQTVEWMTVELDPGVNLEQEN
jgi:uncharacterized protein with HEPN domain